MDGEPAVVAGRPRTGLVLGAGGVLGAAWMTGALAALQQRVPWPAGEFDVIVGTSAGSVLAAALRCGLTVDEIVAHQRDGPTGALSVLGSPDLGTSALPPWPRPGVGSPRLLLAALRAPRQVHPWVIASACLPRGRADHAALRSMVQDMLTLGDQRRRLAEEARSSADHLRGPDDQRRGLADVKWPRLRAVYPGMLRGRAGRRKAGARGAPGSVSADNGSAGGAAGLDAGWAADERTWIVAVDYDSGQRVVFGRHEAPRVPLPDAVVASCSVPGWFRPAIIEGRRYVDGGIRSATSADLLAQCDLDEVYVLAPMASLVIGPARTPLEAAERLFRRLTTVALRRELSVLRSAGTKVTLLTPGPEDLDAMGANLMDPARRRTVFETSMRTSLAVGQRFTVPA
jgi:NTE family protein